MMKKLQVNKILDKLDEMYGVDKDGFLHREPWQLLLAIMMSAQSTDAQVDLVLPALYDRYQKVDEMAEAEIEELEGMIKTIGLYHSKAKNMKKCCQQLVAEYNGQVPDNREDLMKLAGVGRKTANLFMSDAYGVPEITVDTHVNRISNKLGWAHHSDPLKVELELQKVLPKDHWIRINIQLIRHGRAVCKARKPMCGNCALSEWCEFQLAENQLIKSNKSKAV